MSPDNIEISTITGSLGGSRHAQDLHTARMTHNFAQERR